MTYVGTPDSEGLKRVLVSVVMPCYNERATIRAAVARVLDAPFEKELIIVDDGSTDGTRDVLENEIANLSRVTLILQDNEDGKKIGLKDAFRALYCLGKYGLFRR